MLLYSDYECWRGGNDQLALLNRRALDMWIDAKNMICVPVWPDL